MRVFILGAGYVGTAAVELFRQAGHGVSTGRRNPRTKGEFKLDVLSHQHKQLDSSHQSNHQPKQSKLLPQTPKADWEMIEGLRHPA